jgi:hypothetical protein
MAFGIKECETCGLPFLAAQGRSRHCCERCRKEQYAQPCVECGGRTCFGATATRVAVPRCDDCARGLRAAERDRLDRAVIDMRELGALNREIADQLGMTEAAVKERIWRMRQRGLEVPLSHYYPQQEYARRRARNLELWREPAGGYR